MILVVKRLECLAVAGASYHDARAVKLSVIEGVHGLAVFQHNIVGDVNDIVDGTNARRAQSHAEPQGRGGDLDILDHACRIAEAQVGRVNAHGKVIFDLIAVATALHNGLVQLELTVEGHGSLAGKTDHREAIGAVGGNFKLHHLVVEHKRLADVHTQLVLILGIENENAVFLLARHIVRGQSQLAHGAKHTVGLYAAQLACLDGYVAGQLGHGDRRGDDGALKDVLRARDDLCHIAAAEIHLADQQMVAVFVGGDLLDLCDDNIFDVVAKHGVALDLGAGVGHAVAVILNIHIADVNVVRQPFH